jgi:hypothetical protein
MLHRLLALVLLSFVLTLPPVTMASAVAPDVLGKGRLVLVPVNLGVRANAEVEPGMEPVWNEMLEVFGTGDRPVTALERNSAAGLWLDVMAEVEQSNQKNVYAAYSLFAKRIAEQIDYETIVFPSLVLRVAKLNGTGASWDGVRRHVDAPLVGHEAVNKITGPDLLVSREGLTGEIAAASLHVAVLDDGGELRFEGAGGLALLQDVVQGETRGDAKLAVTMKVDAFTNEEELREGIEGAFRKPLPASRAH